MESWVQIWRPRTNAFCDFSSPCLWSIALGTKKWGQVIRSAAPIKQSHLAKPTDLMLQNATPLRKSAPGPPNSSDEHVSCTAPATENAPLQISFLEMRQNPHVLLTFDKVHNPLRLPRETTSEPPKVARACGALYILTLKCASRHNGVHFFGISTSKSAPNVRCFSFFTCKCASRHNGVHFFDILTSKSGPTMVCFVHFHFEMCFAPQRRAIFHLSSGQMAPHPPL